MPIFFFFWFREKKKKVREREKKQSKSAFYSLKGFIKRWPERCKWPVSQFCRQRSRKGEKNLEGEKREYSALRRRWHHKKVKSVVCLRSIRKCIFTLCIYNTYTYIYIYVYIWICINMSAAAFQSINDATYFFPFNKKKL